MRKELCKNRAVWDWLKMAITQWHTVPEIQRDGFCQIKFLCSNQPSPTKDDDLVSCLQVPHRALGSGQAFPGSARGVRISGKGSGGESETGRQGLEPIDFLSSCQKGKERNSRETEERRQGRREPAW